LIGLVGQFSIMPFIDFGLETTAALPPEIAAGIILVG
jgi:predicted Na+-dependent transporter